MKLKFCFVLLLIISALLAQTENELPLHKKALQVSYLLDFDSDLEELVFFSYKKHISNNNAHKISINGFYDLNKNEDKIEGIKLNKLINGFSLSYLFLHYPKFENEFSFYYGIGLKCKYYYQENKEIKPYTSGDLITTDIHKKWTPIFFPCFGYEYNFFSNLSFNFEYSIAMGYSNEVLKIKGKHEDFINILSNKEKEEYFLNPVNIEIGVYYYF